MPGQRIVTMEIGLEAPLCAEPAGLEGLAGLVVRTADESTGPHPGAAFAEAMESIGASYDGSAGLAGSHVGVDVPVTRFDAAAELFVELLNTTSLVEEDIARQIDAARASLAQTSQRGSSLAEMAAARALWPVGSRSSLPTIGTLSSVEKLNAAAARALWPVGSRSSLPTIGTLSSVEKLNAAAAREFWAAHWTISDAVLVVAGEGVEDLDLSIFKEWTTSGSPSQVAPLQPRLDGPRVILVDRPDAVQADVRIQQATVGRSHPGWAALKVACGALGGTFGSRLNQVLREDKGWSYGVGMSSRPLPDGGVATVAGSFRTEVGADAVAEALRILTSSDDLRADEVDAARDHSVGIAPLQYDTAGAVAHQVAALVGAGLAPNWVDDHLAAVASARASAGEWSVNRAWRELLIPDSWRIAICGQAEELAPALAERGLEAVIVSPAEVLS
ncbi:insulinase family protein [Cutibacterium acnes]|uniref:M16 family metallopeptidase n=1 Tax=Cutibacterium acnes TaxID=1747 RepID=UPI001C104496|nr:insulinase family protein [Cutibacterium acnes]MBU5197660.1 insulinase family protein [Cutibacterium acnes]